MRIHVALYQATRGRGHHLPGHPPMLLLDHVGAKSRKRRTSGLTYMPYDASFIVVGSNGGRPHNPAAAVDDAEEKSFAEDWAPVSDAFSSEGLFSSPRWPVHVPAMRAEQTNTFPLTGLQGCDNPNGLTTVSGVTQLFMMGAVGMR